MISVIIPTYNHAESLRVTLHTLAQQTLDQSDFEVVVIDDGSTDHTADIVRTSTLSNLHYHHQPNQGEIAARNAGVSLARGMYLTFLDDDILVSPHYLAALRRAHTTAGQQALVVGNVSSAYRGASTQAMELLREHTPSNPAFAVERIHYIEVCSHSLFLLSTSYEEIGGMKPLTADGRNAWGGIDFAYRAHRLGYSVLRASAAAAIHNDRGLRSYASIVLRWERRCALAVLLLRRYPALQGQIPMLRDKEEIDWDSDGGRLIARKLIKTGMALPLVTELIDWVVTIAPPAWTRQFQVWGAEPHMIRGFQRGLRRYGSVRRHLGPDCDGCPTEEPALEHNP